VAATGQDEMAEVLRVKLESSGIGCAFITLPDWSTITKIRLVSRNQQMLRADFEKPAAVAVDDLIASIGEVSTYDAIIFSDYDKGVFVDPASVISRLQPSGKPILVDPKFKPFADYKGATVIKPNTLELHNAVGYWQSDAEMISKCRVLMDNIGCQAMLVTRASEGMTLIEKEDESHFPARTREVYDTSGAGDTVIAVLATALASGQTLKDAVALSNIAAGIVVSHFGVTSVSGPELRDEVDVSEPANRGKMTAEQAAVAVQVAKSRGERVVFTNGCFDILHAGHVDYLMDAKKEGDRLIVAINSDESVHRLKGEGRPINPLERRMTMLAGLSAVDWVVPFDDDTPEALLRLLQPDVLVKGGDYSVDQVVGAEIVRAEGGEVKVLSLVEDCSTSALVEKIRDL
jgi:D-beta-D-heptose 7-phosphate kinase/D-beta-D-heptose 1-phosphate adenosyltransferase